MTPPQLHALLFVAALSIITWGVFGGLLGGLRKTGGHVRVDHFALPELLMTIVLGAYFASIILSAMLRGSAPATKISVDLVLPSSALFLLFAAAIAGFMRYRGTRLRTAFGGDRMPASRVLLVGLGLILAAFPLIFLGNMITQILLGQTIQEQELVTLFRDVVHSSNRSGIAQIVIAGAIIAPLCEEFLFRGFFYGVGKRYLGPVASGLITSAFFAANHANIAAFPSLFILALCFTIAYEASGSLLVPMVMHALFNSAQLVFLYLITLYGPPA